MATVFQMRTQAGAIARHSTSADIKLLASIVEELCIKNEELEKIAKTAYDEAMKVNARQNAA